MKRAKKKKKTSKKIFPINQLPCLHILKSTSCLLKDGQTYLVLAYMYVSREEARGDSQHRWEGLIYSKEDLKNMMKEMATHYANDWKWPGIEEFQLKYGSAVKCRNGISWIENRIKNAKPWKEFYENLKIGQKDGWPIDDFQLDDGTHFELTDDEDKVLSLKGKRISRIREKEEPPYYKLNQPRLY